MFQRLSVDPCSLSVIRYTPLRPFLLRMNDTGGSVASLIRPARTGRDSAAVIGGGAGG
jgi:probable phosphoglycerate mutase